MLTVKRLGSLPSHSSRLSEGVVTCHVTPLLDAVQVFHNSPNKSRHHSLAVNYHIYIQARPPFQPIASIHDLKNTDNSIG